MAKDNKVECFICGFRHEIDQIECPACRMGKYKFKYNDWVDPAYPVDEKELTKPATRPATRCLMCNLEIHIGRLCPACEAHQTILHPMPGLDEQYGNEIHPMPGEKILFQFEIPADVLKENQIYKVVIYGKK